MRYLIAVEEFKRFKLADLGAVLVLAIAFSVINWLMVLLKDSLLRYAATIALIGFFIAFVGLIVRKSGSVMLFMLLSSLFSIGRGIIGVSGLKKVLAYIVAGLIFEVIFLLFKLELGGAAIDAAISSSVSCGLMPFVVGMILSYGVLRKLVVNLLNLALVSFLSGLLGSIIAIIVWSMIKNKKMFVRLRYAP